MSATDTIMCDGCSEETALPTTCDHGRTLCSLCIDFTPCRYCTWEARP